MPFPITTSMTQKEFSENIINYYWKDLKDSIAKSPFKCVNAADLPDDYAKIGSFLTNKGLVETALKKLEDQIRLNPTLKNSPLPKTQTDVNTYYIPAKDGGSKAHLKSHKLLTDALRKFEAENGFNHERIINGTFHDEAIKAAGKLHSTAAISDKQGKLTSVGKEKPTDTLSKPVELPRGAPTILGDLDPIAFNVLLRHGYQFKDVAAGAYHGEYTHRLQWFAIMHGALGLKNSFLDIFRSLGYGLAKADQNVSPSGSPQLWMWQALFDTAETQEDAVRLRTFAYTTNMNIYTCPENMNKSLMGVNSNMGDTIGNIPLWYLRVLLKTRWKKRFDETLSTKSVGLNKLLNEKLPQDKTRMVLASDSISAMVPKVEKVKNTVAVQKKVYNQQTKQFELKDTTETRLEDKVIGVDKVTKSLTKIENMEGYYALAWYLRNDTVN